MMHHEIKGPGSPILRYGSLLLLVFHNSLTVILMRIAQTTEGPRFITGSLVVMSEVFKILICAFLFWMENNFDVTEAMRLFRVRVILEKAESLKISVPAACFTIQNFLVYLAISKLDVTTYQGFEVQLNLLLQALTYQLKLLTTGLFSYFILGRRLSPLKWISLVLLMAGVALVQLSFIRESDGSSNADQQEIKFGNWLIGISSIIIACLVSSFAAVYFELILKSSNQSLVLLNIQLAFYSLVAAAFELATNSLSSVLERGFFVGFNFYVWAIVLLFAFGGLITAAATKYADSILKSFSTSLAVVVSAIFNVYLFDFVFTSTTLMGVLLVVVSVSVYNFVH